MGTKIKDLGYTSAITDNGIIIYDDGIVTYRTDIVSLKAAIITGVTEAANAIALANNVLLDGVRHDAAAPTPAKSGKGTFTSSGTKPAWLTVSAGVTTVNAGDEFIVLYTAPSTYTYTHVPNTGNYALNAESISPIAYNAAAPSPDIPIGTTKTYEFNTGGDVSWLSNQVVEIGDNAEITRTGTSTWTRTYANINRRVLAKSQIGMLSPSTDSTYIDFDFTNSRVVINGTITVLTKTGVGLPSDGNISIDANTRFLIWNHTDGVFVAAGYDLSSYLSKEIYVVAALRLSIQRVYFVTIDRYKINGKNIQLINY